MKAFILGGEIRLVTGGERLTDEAYHHLKAAGFVHHRSWAGFAAPNTAAARQVIYDLGLKIDGGAGQTMGQHYPPKVLELVRECRAHIKEIYKGHLNPQRLVDILAQFPEEV